MATVRKWVYQCTQCRAKCQMLVKRAPNVMCSHCDSKRYKYVGAYVERDVPTGECPVLGQTAYETDGEPFGSE